MSKRAAGVTTGQPETTTAAESDDQHDDPINARQHSDSRWQRGQLAGCSTMPIRSARYADACVKQAQNRGYRGDRGRRARSAALHGMVLPRVMLSKCATSCSAPVVVAAPLPL